MAGLLVCALICGWHSLHLFIQIAGTAVILFLGPRRHAHIISFVWCFTYLTFFRLAARAGESHPIRYHTTTSGSQEF